MKNKILKYWPRNFRRTCALSAVLAGLSANSHAVAPSYTWSALVDSQPTTTASISLRGLELSSDNAFVYGSWIQPTGASGGVPYRAVVQYDAVTGAELNRRTLNIGSPTTTNGNQVKALATDDRGYVWVGTGQPAGAPTPFVQSFTASLGTESGPYATSGNATVDGKLIGGLAVRHVGPTYYLYVAREGGPSEAYIQRININNPLNPVLDTSFGTGGYFNVSSLQGFSTAGFARGIEVGVDGTIYLATVDNTGAGPSSGRVYRIASDLSSATSAAVSGAFDISLAGSELYVSRYSPLNTAGVTVLNEADLSLVTNAPTGTATFPRTNANNDNGYSDIDVASDGRIFVADQVWNAGNNFDRLLVATPSPEPASGLLLGLGGLAMLVRRRRASVV